ncbi:MAG: SAVED domain-containing protein [Chloroflexi bacterium]|nr:SAVED domain-containing protein [Chloroflexota bacterium]
MTEPVEQRAPSLLEAQSRGGDIAEGGFTYQEAVTLAQLPRWLADDSFTELVREAMGDVEARFFVPGRGFMLELVEAKNHTLPPAKFWGEIARFRSLDQGCPGAYRRFSLVAPGLSPTLRPVADGLRRIRDPQRFYGDGPITDQSYHDWLAVVARAGHDEAEARFLFERVDIDDDFAALEKYGEGVFRQALTAQLPGYQDLSDRVLRDMHSHLATLLRSRRNQPIARRELEATLRDRIATPQRPAERPVILHTAASDDTTAGVRFEWAEFFGGHGRDYPPAGQWDARLLGELEETRRWIQRHRGMRRIALTGERRLSAALAIGAVFSAVAGFAIEIHHRGLIWATDAYPTAATPPYPLKSSEPTGRGAHLVISIGILREIATEVEGVLPGLGLSGMPMLRLAGHEPVVSPDQANVLAGQIKAKIALALACAGSTQVDLFFAGPSPLALFLGHRLNAIAPVQCYEWTGPGRYVPTCRLFTPTVRPGGA